MSSLRRLSSRFLLIALLLLACMASPSQVEAGSLYLTWTDTSGDEDGFKIERSNGSIYVEVATVGANVQSYTDSGLAEGNIYCYRVRAFNSEGYSDYSEEVCETASGPGVPGIASLLSPSGTITNRTPTYTWNAVPGATWYYLWVDDSAGTRITQWYTASDVGCASGTGICSVRPSTALGFGTGQWWIQTWNDAGYGPWSSAMSFTVRRR